MRGAPGDSIENLFLRPWDTQGKLLEAAGNSSAV